MKNDRAVFCFVGGAVLGALAMALLAPESRRHIRQQLGDFLGDGEAPWLDEIEQEAAATEGGLAGTRAWRHASSAQS